MIAHDYRAMHFSAKRGIEIACRLSVCLSFRPSVRNVGWSGPRRLQILETNCTNNLPNIFALRSPNAIHRLPGQLGANWGRVRRGGVGKMRSGAQNRQYLWNAKRYRKRYYRGPIGSLRSFERYHPRPLRPPLPKIGSLHPPKTPIAIISGMGKATNFKFGQNIHRVHPNKSPLNFFGKKGCVGVSRDCPIFSGTPYYLRNGKSYGFQIWPVHSEGPSEQKPIKNLGAKGVWA